MRKIIICIFTLLLSAVVMADTFSIRAVNKVKQEVLTDPYFFTIIPVGLSVTQCPENNGGNAIKVSYQKSKMITVTSKTKQKQVCLGYLTNDIPSNSVFMNNPVRVRSGSVVTLIRNPAKPSNFCFTSDGTQYCNIPSQKKAN